MARPKKSEEAAKDSTSLQISIEDFVRTRDSVVTGLATLQSAVQDLSRAYIAHTNTVIGKGTGSSLELLNFANPLGGENGLFSGRVTTPAPVLEQGEVKKKKRATHDKNAPKRPITAYFLYMSYAREGIARDMGSGASAKQVADEGTHRWNSMGDEEKQKWKHLYGCNYAAYKKKVEAYKAGRAIPEFTKEEAQQLYDEQRQTGTIPDPVLDPVSDHDQNLDSGEEEDEEESDTSSSEEDEQSPEPPKAISPPKSPRASKRGKGAKDRVEKKATPVKEAAPVERRSRTLEVGRKQKTSKKRDARVMDEPTEPQKETQVDTSNSPTKPRKDSDSKQKRKKRKTEVTGV
ncbi:MAG: hypothetical protein Q9211_000166 [Gyalolechia sp. 1 TL-2023]